MGGLMRFLKVFGGMEAEVRATKKFDYGIL